MMGAERGGILADCGCGGDRFVRSAGARGKPVSSRSLAPMRRDRRFVISFAAKVVREPAESAACIIETRRSTDTADRPLDSR